MHRINVLYDQEKEFVVNLVISAMNVMLVYVSNHISIFITLEIRFKPFLLYVHSRIQVLYFLFPPFLLL